LLIHLTFSHSYWKGVRKTGRTIVSLMSVMEYNKRDLRLLHGLYLFIWYLFSFHNVRQCKTWKFISGLWRKKKCWMAFTNEKKHCGSFWVFFHFLFFENFSSQEEFVKIKKQPCVLQFFFEVSKWLHFWTWMMEVLLLITLHMNQVERKGLRTKTNIVMLD